MNIQKVSAVNFGDIYYENANKRFRVTPNQRKVWPIVSDRLNPYISNIVQSLEKQAEVDVVLIYKPDGTTNLTLRDTYDKFSDKTCDDADFIKNFRSPKIAVTFTNRDQETWDGITKKLNIFIERCHGYLKTLDPNYEKDKN